jgi:hypothetical protein
MQSFLSFQKLGTSQGTAHIRAAPGKALVRVDGDDSFFVARNTKQFRFPGFATTSQARPLRKMSRHDYPYSSIRFVLYKLCFCCFALFMNRMMKLSAQWVMVFPGPTSLKSTGRAAFPRPQPACENSVC